MLTCHSARSGDSPRRSSRSHRGTWRKRPVTFGYDAGMNGHLLGEYNASGALIQETIWLGDTPVATLRPGSPIDIFYVHTDHLNTPRKVTRPSDNQSRWTWESDPFGAGLPNENPQSLGTFQYNLRFPGQIYDAHTGLNYNYFRDYDSVTGRYVQSDPIGLAGGLNTYSYVDGNPLASVDPFGLQKLPRVAPLTQAIRNEIATARVPNLVRQIQLYNPSYRGPSVIGPINFGYTPQDVRNLELELQLYRSAGCPAPGATLRWPTSPVEMDNLLGFPGTRIPDRLSTPGRNKVTWAPNQDTSITFEQHPYHPNAPEWHRGPHWHLDTPGAPHVRYLPGEPMPGGK